MAQSKAPFPTPRVGWGHALWAHGDVLYAGAGSQGLLKLQRNGEVTRIKGPRAANGIAGAPDGTLYVYGYDQLGLIKGGRYTAGPRPPETRSGDGIEDIAVDSAGTAYVASRYSGVHIWDGRSMRSAPYPERVEAKQIVVTSDGRVIVSARDGVLLQLQGDRMEYAPFREQARAAAGQEMDFDALWVSPADGHLWIGTGRRLVLEVDLATNNVTTHRVPLFGSIRVITGAAAPGGQQVFVGAQSETGILSASGFRQFAQRLSFPEDAYIDVPSGTLYVINRDGITPLSLSSGQRVAVPEPRPTPRDPARTSASPPPAGGANATGSSTRQRTRSGLSIENMNVQGCGLIAAMAMAGIVQQRAGSCLAAGQSVTIAFQAQGGRARNVRITPPGRQATCAAGRLRNLTVPSSSSACSVSLRLINRP